MAVSRKIGRPTIKKSGKPLTEAEQKRRYRANKKRAQKAKSEAERLARRVEVNGQLGILPLAIAKITDAELASGSVDAVITDPPYAEADVPLYGELARLAMRVLKPSGWCLTMVGDLYLGRVIALMTLSGLLERGLITITFPGGHHSRIHTTKTFQAAKSIVLLQKPPSRQPPGEWGPNLIAVAKNGYDKSLHPWQQSQEAFEKLVDRFTAPGNLVADPFAGSGTTLRAALALGRSAWGADIEELS
jgi:DNA methylase